MTEGMTTRDDQNPARNLLWLLMVVVGAAMLLTTAVPLFVMLAK